MSEPPSRFFCVNHLAAPAAGICPDCGRPFCEACLTELMGQPLCGWCRDTRLAHLQPAPTVNAAAVVLWARIFDGAAFLTGAGVTALYAFLFAVPLLAPPPGSGSRAGNALVSLSPGLIAVCCVGALLGSLVYLPPAIGLGRGRSWLWTWQMVALAMSVAAGCVLLGSIGMPLIAAAAALGIFWIKPEVRAYCEGR